MRMYKHNARLFKTALFLLLFSLHSYSQTTISEKALIQTGTTTEKVSTLINVAVLPFTSTVLNKDETNAITLRFMSELKKHNKYDVMERELMNEILSEQGFQQTGACDEAGCMVEMGRLIAVEKIISGSASKIGNVYILNVQVINLESGKNEIILNKEYDGPLPFFISEFVPIVAAEISGVIIKKKEVVFKDAADNFFYKSLTRFLKTTDVRKAYSRYLTDGNPVLIFRVHMNNDIKVTYLHHLFNLTKKVIKDEVSGALAEGTYTGKVFALEITMVKDIPKNSMGYSFKITLGGVIAEELVVQPLETVPLNFFYISSVRYKVLNQMLVGAACPGLPQVLQERPFSGLIYGGGFWASIGAVIYFGIAKQDAHDSYMAIQPITGTDGVKIITEEQVKELNTHSDKQDEMHQYQSYALISTSLFYLANLADIYLFTEDVNKNNRFRWQLFANPNGIKIKGDF